MCSYNISINKQAQLQHENTLKYSEGHFVQKPADWDICKTGDLTLSITRVYIKLSTPVQRGDNRLNYEMMFQFQVSLHVI